MPGSSGPLGGNETVDAGAQVLQYEILLGRGFAVVDLLGPLLERQFDPKGLVDGERDVEKVQAVDPQILDGVTLWLDGIARDVTRLGDDVGDGIERRGHMNPLIVYVFEAARVGAATRSELPADSAIRAGPYIQVRSRAQWRGGVCAAAAGSAKHGGSRGLGRLGGHFWGCGRAREAERRSAARI